MPHSRSQAGFTLIELLVVVAILGALAAVAIPSVAKFANRGKLEAQKAEKVNVQTSLDALVADQKLAALDPQTLTNDFATHPTVGGAANPLYPGYIRQASGACSYAWDASGSITNQACP